MIIYMIQTIQLIVMTKGEEFAKSIANCGEFRQMKDGTPYLVITNEDQLASVLNVNN